MKKARNLFSLIELMVVFSILAILVSLLQPSLNKIIKSADTLNCANNLHSFFNMFALYIDDHEGKLTPLGRAGPGDYGQYMWFTRFENYNEGTKKIRLCPSTEVTNKFWGTATTAWNWGGRPGSYAFNAHFHSGIYNSTTYQLTTNSTFERRYFKNINNVVYPSETGLLSDSSWVDAWPGNHQPAAASAALGSQPGEPSSMGRLAVNRHEWAVNVLKADGSVRKHALEELWSAIYWNLEDKPQAAPTINP